MRAALLLLVSLTLCAGCKRAKNTPATAPDDRANVKLEPAASTPQPVTQKEVTKKTEPTAAASTLPAETPLTRGRPSDASMPQVDRSKVGDLTKPAPGIGTNPQPGDAAAAPVRPDPVAQAPVARVPDPAVPAVKPLAPAGNTPRGAAKRLVAMADMRDLQLFIDTASLVDGKMPSAADILAALKEARSPVFNMVVDESITLTGIRQREGIWAFETAAYLNGGLAVSQNGVERLTADELRKRLGK